MSKILNSIGQFLGAIGAALEAAAQAEDAQAAANQAQQAGDAVQTDLRELAQAIDLCNRQSGELLETTKKIQTRRVLHDT